MVEIDAERPVDEVWHRVRQALDSLPAAHATATEERTAMSSSRLHRLSALGQSVWLDSLSRTMIEGGDVCG